MASDRLWRQLRKRRMNYLSLAKVFSKMVFGISIVGLCSLLLFSNTNDSSKMTWSALLDGPPAFDDLRLLQIVKEEFLVPSSSLPYDLSMNRTGVEDEDPENDLHFTKYVKSWQYIDRMIKKLFGDFAGEGFFVEAGAQDGEFMSNTLLFLEMERKWNGLLVEPETTAFRRLLKKNRKAWATCCCLSAQPFPYKTAFRKFEGVLEVQGANSLVSLGLKNVDFEDIARVQYDSVQCLPLATLLLALKVTHVDLVSLDVEGAERGVLQHFPWDRILVDVWVVEHEDDVESWILEDKDFTNMKKNLPKSEGLQGRDREGSDGYVDRDFVEFFLLRGYELYSASRDQYPRNYVFLRKDSRHYKRIYQLSGQ